MLYNVIISEFDGFNKVDTYILGTIEADKEETGIIIEKLKHTYNPKNKHFYTHVMLVPVVISSVDELCPPFAKCSCRIYHKKYIEKYAYAKRYYPKSIIAYTYDTAKIEFYNPREDDIYKTGSITLTIPREKYDKMSEEELKKMFEELVPEGYTL